VRDAELRGAVESHGNAQRLDDIVAGPSAGRVRELYHPPIDLVDRVAVVHAVRHHDAARQLAARAERSVVFEVSRLRGVRLEDGRHSRGSVVVHGFRERSSLHLRRGAG